MPRVPEEKLWDFRKTRALCIPWRSLNSGKVWTIMVDNRVSFQWPRAYPSSLFPSVQWAARAITQEMSWQMLNICIVSLDPFFLLHLLVAISFFLLFYLLLNPSSSTSKFLLPDSSLWFNCPSFPTFSLSVGSSPRTSFP